MLKEALRAVDVVTFDYPCEFVSNYIPCIPFFIFILFFKKYMISSCVNLEIIVLF